MVVGWSGVSETHDTRCQYCGEFREHVGTVCDDCHSHIVTLEADRDQIRVELEELRDQRNKLVEFLYASGPTARLEAAGQLVPFLERVWEELQIALICECGGESFTRRGYVYTCNDCGSQWEREQLLQQEVS